MPVPSNIISQLVNVPHEPHLAQAHLSALDLAPGERPPWFEGSGSSIAFQYWPETIMDSRASEWNAISIPGGSHPIYQWTHGGERRISFTAQFTTDTQPEEGRETDDNPYEQQENMLGGVTIGKRDIDIRASVSWLRYYTYPKYGSGNDYRVYEPPKVLLCLPNTKLGHDGQDYLVCVMTQCDVTYEAWFPSGFPRSIEVQLEFAEVVQSRGRVTFHDRSAMTWSKSVRKFGRLNVR